MEVSANIAGRFRGYLTLASGWGYRVPFLFLRLRSGAPDDAPNLVGRAELMSSDDCPAWLKEAESGRLPALIIRRSKVRALPAP
jgi:hypothetical protein